MSVQCKIDLWLIYTARERDRYRVREREQNQWVLIYHEEMFTLIQDRDKDQDPLFPIVLVPFPVPVLLSVPCSVNKPLRWPRNR